MRWTIWIAAVICCAISGSATASPGYDFLGDRYVSAAAPSGTAHRSAKHRQKTGKRWIRQAAAGHRHRLATQGMAIAFAEPRPEPRSFAAAAVDAITTPVRHIAAAVFGGRPQGCPARWCGCWLGLDTGMTARSLWLARNWARVGTELGAPRAGAIAVWAHHVGRITAVGSNGTIRVRSGNDGHRVRERWRSARGVIAYRML